MSDEAHFISEHESTKVPVNLLKIIFKAMHEPAPVLDAKPADQTSSIRASMHSNISAPPSRGEFDSCLASTSNTTMGGMSELTYSMMKAWPAAVTNRVFELLSSMWPSKFTPDWWKWRWICPKPKVTENIGLGDLRPLVLVEVIRKLWTNIIIRRIKACWQKEDLLSQDQHAFRARHGTDTATIQLINALEEARESCTELFISSWDLKRAFDSVAKNILIASWVRLGVPLDIAEWLVHMDTDGNTVIRTPLAKHVWAKQGYAGFESLNDQLSSPGNISGINCTSKPAFFSCDRGTGQGDVGSPSNWLAFMDILLVALKYVYAPFYTRANSHLEPAGDNCFADDMLSLASRHAAMQQKADIVSAFAIVFGMEVRSDKLRAFHYSFGKFKENCPSDLIIHTLGWVPTSVPIATQGDLKFLGVSHDPLGVGSTQLELTKAIIEADCNVISTRRCPNYLKLETLKMRTYPKSIYAAKFMGWRLDSYKKLSKLFDSTVRRTAQLMSSHPRHLLYCPPPQTEVSALTIGATASNRRSQESSTERSSQTTSRNTLLVPSMPVSSSMATESHVKARLQWSPRHL